MSILSKRSAIARARRIAAAMLACCVAFGTTRAFSQDQVGDERVNDAFKRASQFLMSCQEPTTGAIHNRLRNETAMTSLALLAFAAMGHQPADPTPEGQAMKRALDFVLRAENQDATGYFGKSDGSRMYGHGITTLMLAEMLGMGTNTQQDTIIRERCRKAIDLILRAQRVQKNDANRGGWRYTPDATDSDMSITCWQTMALRAARNAGMDVPKESIDLAVRYIKGLYDSGDRRRGIGGFGYSGRGNEASTTAEGLLALQVCGDYDSEEVKGASDRLLKTGLRPGDRWFYYTSYYYAQGMYQRGEKHAAEARSGERKKDKTMQATIEETPVIQKTRDLCQTILDQPEVRQIRERIDAFMGDDAAKNQYQTLMEKGDALQQKQQMGTPLDNAEIAEFEKNRDSLLTNPVAERKGE